jgi:hypothetical protein
VLGEKLPDDPCGVTRQQAGARLSTGIDSANGS